MKKINNKQPTKKVETKLCWI